MKTSLCRRGVDMVWTELGKGCHLWATVRVVFCERSVCSMYASSGTKYRFSVYMSH